MWLKKRGGGNTTNEWVVESIIINNNKKKISARLLSVRPSEGGLRSSVTILLQPQQTDIRTDEHPLDSPRKYLKIHT